MSGFEEMINEIIRNLPQKPKYEELSGTLKFTKKECGKMSAEVGYKLITHWDRVVRIIKRKVGDRFIYILRLRRGGFNIEVQEENIKEAKRRFIKETFKEEEKPIMQLRMAA